MVGWMGFTLLYVNDTNSAGRIPYLVRNTTTVKQSSLDLAKKSGRGSWEPINTD